MAYYDKAKKCLYIGDFYYYAGPIEGIISLLSQVLGEEGYHFEESWGMSTWFVPKWVEIFLDYLFNVIWNFKYV